MTLWDIFDAWTDSALEAPARDNGTHAERIEELKDYTDACSYRDCWDCAPVTDEEAEKIVDCYENGGVNVDELKGINHVRTYKIEVRYLKDGFWGESFTVDETVDALTAEDAKEDLDPDYVESISSYLNENGDAVPYEEAEIRISPRGQVLAEDDDCSFFVEEQINIKWAVKK